MEFIKKNKDLLFFSGVITTAFFLRIFMLSNQNFWLDEAITYDQIKVGNIIDIYKTVMHQTSHLGPLYHITTHLFSIFFGYSEWALRMPSAIYGTVSVIFIYLTVKELFNKNIALLSSILLTLSPLHIWYSQEARMYSLWIMLVLITFYIFIKILSQDKIIYWILFTFFASLSLWSHTNSFFFYCGLGSFLLINIKKYKKTFQYFMLSMLLVTLTFLPVFISLFNKNNHSVGSDRVVSIFDLAYAYYVFNVGNSFGPSPDKIRFLLDEYGFNSVWILLNDSGIILIPLMIIFTVISVYAFYISFKKKKEEEYQIIFLNLIIPSLIIFSVAFFSKTVSFNVRYILCALPFYYIFISYGIDNAPPKIKIFSYTFFIIISLISISNYYFNPEYAKTNISSVTQYLNKTMGKNDSAIILTEGGRRLLGYYDKEGTISKYYVSFKNMDNSLKYIRWANRIFYVKTSRTQQYNKHELKELEDYFKNNFLEIDKFVNIPKVTIYIYSRK